GRRAAHLARLVDGLREAAPLARSHSDASRTLARAVADAEAARRAGEAARRAGDEASLQEARASDLRRSVAPLADLAEEALSQQAARWRSLLVDGEPCPVCGALDHPHVHGQDGLATVAAALKAQRAEHEAVIAAARPAITQSAAAQAAAGARLQDSERVAADARETMEATATAYAAACPSLRAAHAEAGLDGFVPEGLDAEAGAAIAAVVEAAKAARAPLLLVLDGAQLLREEIDGLTVEVEAAGREIEAAELSCAAGREALRVADLAATAETMRAAGLAERIESLGREIAPYLAAAGLSPDDLDRDAKAATKLVGRIAADHRALAAHRTSLDREVQALSTRRAGAVEAAGYARTLAERAKQEAQVRTDGLAALRAERAPLLGGEETGAHRTRINAARRDARDALKRAEDERAAAQAALASATTAADHALAGRDALRQRREEADAAFAAACLPRTVEVVRELLALSPEIRSALRGAVEGRAMEAQEAGIALSTRQADLALLLDAPEIDGPATEAEAASLSETMAAHQQGLGALAADLARDDAARDRAAGLDEKIAEARAEFATWEAVNDAVGSADGGKFRRFAQGVTLEHLVRLANEHLLALSPRYRLVRGEAATLALHVLDRDMGEEVRATRSLSGGERFLVSLALALALSGLEGRESFVDTLFIDEGFGSLDAETLDLAVDALETLQGRGRKVGVITHVAAMIERIAVQVRVEKRGNGRSVVRVVEAGMG
ncbi:SbcC/MukB-like Walker B domain-containing protein, partial [Methylobacterium marchantiae]